MSMKEIYLAGGCFWGIEKYLSLLPGVTGTEVGYANGRTEHPTYRQVCDEDTGHAETVKVRYDEEVISTTFLLERFYEAIDPTALNRQGEDEGTQYRTGIYYTDAADAAIIRGSVVLLGESLAAPVLIEVLPLANYYPAETYHQAYLDKNPAGYCHITPGLMARAAQAVDEASAQRGAAQRALRERLDAMQYEVTQNGATEPPFENAYCAHFEAGIYVDVTTGTPLFVSTDKFESGCGWPSFSKPIDGRALQELEDTSFGRQRTEVRASGSDAHLGHVFADGPAERGGLRYCINSASLRFVPKAAMEAEGYGALLGLVEAER